MAVGRARYDGFADWYESFRQPSTEATRAEVAQLLSRGEGLCLDLCCGTGVHFEAIKATGRTPVGVEFSGDQLRHAHSRGRCVQADAATLPFPDALFPTVLMVWMSTDVDDFAAVVREATRVLRPGGMMVFAGAHPCFMGPHIEYREDGGRIIHPTYRLADWHDEQAWWTNANGLRNRVGMRQVPLAEFLHAFIDAGLVIEKVAEPEPDLPVPNQLTVRLTRPPVSRHRS